MQYVDRCFNSASLFHKALKEAFESFCNKPVANCQMAQLMADYCNALLKKVRAACDTLSWPRQEPLGFRVPKFHLNRLHWRPSRC